jgi:hypothetical protein
VSDSTVLSACVPGPSAFTFLSAANPAAEHRSVGTNIPFAPYVSTDRSANPDASAGANQHSGTDPANTDEDTVCWLTDVPSHGQQAPSSEHSLTLAVLFSLR